jgi:hypothetical protein
MRLRDLEAEFLRREMRPDTWTVRNPDGSDGQVSGMRIFHVPVASLAEAHGVKFLCPKCFAANNGPVGTHGVICWFVGKVPADARPRPGRWNPAGTGLDDLTFVAPGAYSVLLTAGCMWHGFVTAGGAE